MPGKKVSTSGSPATGEPAFLAIGKVRRSHGVHGELVAELYTDFPERIRPGTKVFLGEQHTAVVLQAARFHNEGLLLSFEGVNTPEDVGKYRNQVIYTPTRSLPELSDGEYYFHQLLGLDVYDESGLQLGKLLEIIETGANDVYVVRGADDKEILLPAIPDVVLKIDMETRSMSVHLLPGLADGTADDA